MRSRSRTLLAALALATALVTAGPASTASAAPCGFYTAENSSGVEHAYWHNCHSYANHYIGADIVWWPDDYYCVENGATQHLGFAGDDWGEVRGARLIYLGCPA